MEKLVTSFDIVGDIAVIEIPRGLGKRGKIIAEAIMKIHKNIKVVAKKSPVEGRYRVRGLKVIAGDKRTETVHKESGCLMKLDAAKAYFSVRLSHERERIAAMVKDNEKVLILFAGVGPFALVIAKKVPTATVAGIELNPYAVKYFEENVKLNKLKNCDAIKGDVRRVVPKKFVNWADRVLMPLPKSAENFLDTAILASRNNAVVHFYHFGKHENVFKDAEEKIMKAAKKSKCSAGLINSKIVRPYAPGIVQIVVDFKIKK